MKRSTKRLVSLLICLAMALAILPVAAFAAGTTTVYCQAPATWTNCNAYWWGSSSANPSWPGETMTQDADGIWSFDVPSDATGLIFNNGSGTQTGDMTVPTDDKVMYVFANNYWTTYGKVEVVTEYYVAGTASLCGVDWQPGAAQNKMTEADGIYTITFTGIAAGTHKFKVTNGTWDQSWGQDAGINDYVLELTEATNTVEIQFDPDVPSVDVIVNGAGHEAPPPVDGGIYYVAGDFNGWTAAAEGYQMTATGVGVYSYTMTLDAADYQLKVTNGTWDLSWGAATASGNYEFNVANDASTVTVTFDFATQQVSVTVTAPGSDSEGTLIAEGTATFADRDAAYEGVISTFVPAEDGTVTIEVSACDSGFFVDIYKDGEWADMYEENAPRTISYIVTKGVSYEFVIGTMEELMPGLMDYAAGSLTYKITADVAAGEPGQGGGEDPGQGGGSSELDPLPVPEMGMYIEAGETVWFIHDNYEHMMNDGVYSQMLHISASVPYAVTYRGADVPVDVESESTVYYVNYEMMDMMYQGTYVFSVTNNGSAKAFFSIEVKDRPAYVVSDYTLVLGDNVVVPDTEYANTLYEFTPEQTGIYTFTISEGVIGNWGTIFNPQDNTGTKDTVLQWTCSAEGQSVLIGVAQTEEAVLTVARTGDYVAEEQVDETVYENTYGFTYQIPENAELVAIDVLDNKADVAVLDKDSGFYRYGSAYGPLMVADLNEFPVNLADAYINGQLRAYVYDDSGKLIARYDYNEAMNEYLEAGLVPVTEELSTMLKQVGDHHDWWQAGGFVFKEAAPADEDTAWMTACSYIKGSELEAPSGGNQGGNNQGGNQNGSGNQGGNGNSNPKTTDISMALAVIAMILAGTCLVVLKKKETFFVG